MTSSSLLPPGSRSSSDSDSSDSSVGDVNVNRLNQSQGAISQTDDLVSVTIQKSSPAQKVGISLVERKNHVFVTNVAESGLFHGTDLKVGDKIISINGKRPNEGEGAKHILKLISKAKATVTIVVEKPKRKPRRRVISLSPMTQRKKKTMGKLRRNEANRKDDPSLTHSTGIQPKNDRPQIPISANKLFSTQDVGIRFKDIDNMVFISAIMKDSIFKDTRLEVGDRIVGLAGINFMSRGDSKYARQLILNSPQKVTFVIEKGHTSFDEAKKVDSTHDTTLVVTSQHSERKSMSSRKHPSGNSSSDDDNRIRVLEQSGNVGTPSEAPIKKKKLRKLKGGNTAKSPSIRPKTLTKGSASTHSRSSHQRKQMSRGDNDSEESSLGDYVTEEQKAKTVESTSPPTSRSPNTRSISKLNQSATNLKKIDTFDYENFQGDYIKVTVRKESETQPGISLEQNEDQFFLTAVPDNEKRIHPGMQVLAINGIANINNISKAEDLIKHTKGAIQLIINFSSPLKPPIKCPACSRLLAADGKHANGMLSRRVVRRKVDEETLPADGAEMMSIAASEITTRVTNKAPPGTRAPIRPDRPPKYQFHEFDSDSDEEGQKSSPRSSRRQMISTQQPRK